MNDNTTNKVPNAAFAKTRDYFLGESLTPSENVPDLLAENRKIAISLAESVMSLMDVIANYFGIPTSWKRTAFGSRQRQGHIWTSKDLSPWLISARAHTPTRLLRCTA